MQLIIALAIGQTTPINIVMALPALKDLVLDDALTKPMALSLSGSPAGPVSVADYAKALPAFEQLSRERVAHFISSRTKLAVDIKSILSSSPELLADVLLHIDRLVEVVSKVIDDQKARLEAGRIETDRKIAKAAAADGNAAELLRKLQTRLLKAEADFINALVEYYYFLLALRAEHDPDARGGPSFDNPDDLAAYLREQIEA
ncbi:MAG: hypothetical protein QOJ15_1338 [Bradyrhizobium sp.]|jgi:hypothetical protein|nr:hypothetical protein [Bradyrhizobium sp.]